MTLSPTAQKIFNLKYAQKNETWEQACLRVALHVASAYKDDYRYNDAVNTFYNLMVNKVFIPGGRILANSGTGISNLMNCFVLPIHDSRESIYTTLKNAAEIFAHGGGVGFNFSEIRERNAPIKTTGGKASGPLSFLTLFDQTGEVIQQASRRGAQIAFLNIDHPDIEHFINYKNILDSRNARLLSEYQRNLERLGLDTDGTEYFKVLEKTLTDDQLTHFNISVMLNDKFMWSVINNESWNLTSRLDNKVVKVVDANKLIYQLAEQAWNSGDPGIAFFERINEDNMTPYLGSLSASNPCLYKDTLLLDGTGLCKISAKARNWSSWKSGIKKCIKLITNAGHELILTPEHRIMLEDGSFIEAKDAAGKDLKWGLGRRFLNKVDSNYVLIGFLFGRGFIENNSCVYVKVNKNKEKSIYNFLIKSESINAREGIKTKSK